MTGYGILESAQHAIRIDILKILTKFVSLGELEHAIDRAWQRTEQSLPALNPNDLAPRIATPHATTAEPDCQAIDVSEQGKSLEDFERRRVLEALKRHQGNRTAAAKELGISVRQLYYRLPEYRRP